PPPTHVATGSHQTAPYAATPAPPPHRRTAHPAQSPVQAPEPEPLTAPPHPCAVPAPLSHPGAATVRTRTSLQQHPGWTPAASHAPAPPHPTRYTGTHSRYGPAGVWHTAAPHTHHRPRSPTATEWPPLLGWLLPLGEIGSPAEPPAPPATPAASAPAPTRPHR